MGPTALLPWQSPCLAFVLRGELFKASGQLVSTKNCERRRGFLVDSYDSDSVSTSTLHGAFLRSHREPSAPEHLNIGIR